MTPWSSGLYGSLGVPQSRGWEGCRAAAPPPQNEIKKKQIFVDTVLSKAWRDLRSILN